MRVLMIGDVCGAPGRRVLTRWLPELRRGWGIDWVVANLENLTQGRGLSPGHLRQMLAAGVDVVTTGNHLFSRPDWPEVAALPMVLRPQNLGGERLAGRGWWLAPVDAAAGGAAGSASGAGVASAAGERPRLAVLNLAGRVFLEPAECPFRWADRLLAQIPAGVPVVVDFHAEATSEKLALTAHLDGRVSVVAGTHTHVQTADERISPRGTAAITDLGMTGPIDSIIGIETGTVLRRFIRMDPEPFRVVDGPGCLAGLLIDLVGVRAARVARVRIDEHQAALPPEPAFGAHLASA